MTETCVNEKYEKKYLKMLKNKVLSAFKNNDCKIYLFGSRAAGIYQRSSDYDIGIEGVEHKIFVQKKIELESEIEESIIPHKIDLINIDDTDDEFKKIALRKVKIWKNYSKKN